MTTSTTYPNGQVLVSSALTIPQANVLLQILTCGMIGVNPPDFSKVRIDWPTQGQPFANVAADICYLACLPEEGEYNKVRDLQTDDGPTGKVTETWTFTKIWRMSWTFYGPQSTANASAVRDALFQDYFNDQLSISNLFPVSNPSEVTRVPEQFNAQWWERADYHITMYESVTQTIQSNVVLSVENKINTADGLVADFTVTKP